MAKIIRHVNDLPEWFSLAKYERAKDLDAQGWYEQLSVRRALVDDYREPGDFADVLPLVRETPIVDVISDLSLSVYFSDCFMYEHRQSAPFYSLGVRPATARDHYRIESRLHPEGREFARRYFDYHLNDRYSIEDLDDGGVHSWLKPIPEEFEKSAQSLWLDVPIDWVHDGVASSVSAMVDLDLPDEMLMEQFKLFLEEQRKVVKTPEFQQKKWIRLDFPGWVRFGVLPYLDLKIWSIEAGVKIPSRVMADAIFPPGEGGEDVLNKTTAVKAPSLIKPAFLRTLASIASAHKLKDNDG